MEDSDIIVALPRCLLREQKFAHPAAFKQREGLSYAIDYNDNNEIGKAKVIRKIEISAMTSSVSRPGTFR